MINPPTFNDFNALEDWIADAGHSGHQGIYNKGYLYNRALNRLRSEEIDLAYYVHQSPRLNPDYFKETFANKKIDTYSTSDFYGDYETQTERDYWVDFANSSLGGGAFSTAFVQEEKMVAEIPQLANHICSCLAYNQPYCTLKTRIGSPHVGQGLPTPIVFEGVVHVQRIDNVYHGKNLEQVYDISEEVTDSPLQKVNILAMAAPKVASKNDSFQLETIQDIFNTAIAGFSSCKKPALIHTGPLGAGAFNNDAKVSYVVQKLAAEHIGVDLLFHGYSKHKAQGAESIHQEIKKVFLSQKKKHRTIENLLQITSNLFGDKYL